MYLVVAQPGLGAYRGQMARHLPVQRQRALRGCAPCTLGNYRRRPQHTLGANVAAQTGVSAAATAATFIPVVGPVLGPLIGAIGGLFFGASAKRAAEAKTENSAVNQLMPAAIQQIQAIVASVNAGQLDTATASSQLDQIVAGFQQTIQQYASTPGSAMRACTPVPGGACANSAGYGNEKCDSGCTVGCCMLCQWLIPTVCRIKQLFASSGGTISIPATGSSGYGYTGTSGFSLTYSPAGAAGGIGGALSSLTSGTMLGLPTWVWLVGGGGLVLVLYLSQGNR